jgi:hypothetical protein
VNFETFRLNSFNLFYVGTNENLISTMVVAVVVVVVVVAF